MLQTFFAALEAVDVVGPTVPDNCADTRAGKANKEAAMNESTADFILKEVKAREKIRMHQEAQSAILTGDIVHVKYSGYQRGFQHFGLFQTVPGDQW